MSGKWRHTDRLGKTVKADHPVDPHYSGNGYNIKEQAQLPSVGRSGKWECHTCREPVRP